MDSKHVEVPKPEAQDISAAVSIDYNVAKFFPRRYKSSAGRSHGASFWTKTARLDVECEDGSIQSYFLKTGRDDIGFKMMRSEYEGVKTLYQIVPKLVPRPIGWGTYLTDTRTHFYLADYVQMAEEISDIDEFVALLAKLHRDSMPHSPNGKFGFHVTTYGGTMPTPVEWCDTWEESYSANLKGFAEQERTSQGRSEDLDRLLPQLFGNVIPRLLRPLAANGVRPCLIHGDLWYGNIATNIATKEPIAFDPTVYWAHNEYELASFPIPRYRLGRQFMRAYHRHFPISQPVEDYEDRMLLYGIHCHLCCSILYPASSAYRDQAITDIKYLVEKYPNGYNDFAFDGDKYKTRKDDGLSEMRELPGKYPDSDESPNSQSLDPGNDRGDEDDDLPMEE